MEREHLQSLILVSRVLNIKINKNNSNDTNNNENNNNDYDNQSKVIWKRKAKNSTKDSTSGNTKDLKKGIFNVSHKL